MTEKTSDVSRREFMKQAGLSAAALAASATPLGRAIASEIKDGMGYRTLGRTGLKISEVAVGGGPMTPERTNLLRAALSQGINYIDTANSYGKGQSETAIGETLKSMGNRDKVVIATKGSGIKHSALMKAPASEVEKALRAKLEESLARLQTDYIDIYHCPHGASSLEETAYPGLREALDKFKEEGKIRFTAVSTHDNFVNVSLKAIEDGYYDVLMTVICSPTLIPRIGEAAKKAREAVTDKRMRRVYGRRPILDARPILRAAQEKNVGLIAMKGAKDQHHPDAIHGLVKRELAGETDLSFHQVAYRFVLDQPGVSGVCIGMGQMRHLEEALALPKTTLKG